MTFALRPMFLRPMVAPSDLPSHASVWHQRPAILAWLTGCLALILIFVSALAAAEQGLAMASTDGRLIAEKGRALTQLARFETALAHYDRVLNGDEFLLPVRRAMIPRAHGFALTELHRYDDAERTYRESLILEPNHAGARNELSYIARVRAGGAPTAPVITTYDKAKSGQ